MTTSPDNADAALAAEVTSDGPVDITRASRPATELLVELEINLISRPDDWRQLVLETIGQWPEASETLNDVHYQYLIGGEAFDWRLLATTAKLPAWLHQSGQCSKITFCRRAFETA